MDQVDPLVTVVDDFFTSQEVMNDLVKDEVVSLSYLQPLKEAIMFEEITQSVQVIQIMKFDVVRI